MYNYQILTAIGITATMLIIVLVIYLIISYKKGRLFKKIGERETERFNALGITMLQSQYVLESAVSSYSLGRESWDGHYSNAGNVETVHPSGFNLKDDVRTMHDFYGRLDLQPVRDFDAYILEGQYTLLAEIPGGGMGRVFLARKDNVGNDWIIKFVPPHIGELTNEADILKDLRHTALPQIIDIFEDYSGLYLVESFIDGDSMKGVLHSHKTDSHAEYSVIPEHQILDWAEQLAQVLSYLHKRAQPIFHLDLKPSNIMVTPDNNKLVLIDFGISQRQTDDMGIKGATYSYAAPEQLKRPLREGRRKALINERFGTLPEARKNWKLDGRTDIYSLGVVLFEAAVGEIPKVHNRRLLKECLSKGMCDIINKCLEVNPAKRYQSADKLLADLLYQKRFGKERMGVLLRRRKFAKIASVLLMPLALFMLASGFLIREAEAVVSMYVDPEILTVSVMQHSEVQITRVMPDVDNSLVRMFVGRDSNQPMDPSRLRWDVVASHVAQVDGNRVQGLNVGETMVHGYYRDQAVSMLINVIEPMDGYVDISMRFRPGNRVRLYAGTNYREHVDGALHEAEFISPESMAITDSGSIYFADSGWLRRIYNGMVETVDFGPFHLQPRLVRAYGNDIYVLTHAWSDDTGYYFGIVRHTSSGPVVLYEGDAMFTDIRDFAIADDGLIYFVERNDGVGATYLRTLDMINTENVYTLAELSLGVSAMSISNDRIFLADANQGVLAFFQDGQLTHLAGLPDELAFIDGPAPLFYRPTRIQYHNGDLFVWDFNVLRKIILEDGAVVEAISIAGVASPEFSLEHRSEYTAESIVLPFSLLTDFLIKDEGILITDPRRGVIWRFEE